MKRQSILILLITISLSVAASVALATGDCTDYVDLTGMELPIAVSGRTADATDDYHPFESGSEPPGCWEGQWHEFSGVGPDRTFKWTVPSTGYYAISLARSDFNADLFLYDFTCPDEPVYPDDFICGSHNKVVNRGFLSDLELYAGQEILIVVDGFNNTSGAFVLEIFDTELNFDAYLQMAMEVHHFPGMGVGLVNDDGLWNEVYGTANLEEERAVTDSTSFIVWSTSKAVTAAVLMTCWEDGLFELDEDVNEYLQYGEIESFEVHHPHHSEIPITMRQSMCHVASVIDDWATLIAVAVIDGDSPITIGQFCYDYLNPEGAYYDANANFGSWPPGTAWQYAQPDVTLAAYITECVSDSLTFLERCQERIFDPLDMTRSTYLLAAIEPDELAMLYTWNGNNHTPYIAGHAPWYPAAILRTNAIELTRFLAAIMNGGELDGQQILQPATIDSMLTVQYPEIPSEPPGQGLLWRWEEIGGRELWGHSGGGGQSLASVMFSPTENIGAVVMTNSGGSGWEGLDFVVDALLDHATRFVTVGIEDGPQETIPDGEVPSAGVSLAVHPNPFNPRTTISFSIDHPQNVELCIFDMTGKRIALLADRAFQAGGHSIDWQGKDIQGRDVASGTYLVRMVTDERVTSEKMMLIR